MEFLFFFGAILVLGFGLLIAMHFSRRHFTPREQKFFQKEWNRIVATVENDPRLAVIEADKLLDYALRKKGYRGSLGQKLKRAGSLFSNLDRVWEAHKLRNAMVHELNVAISKEKASQAIHMYERALRDLGVAL